MDGGGLLRSRKGAAKSAAKPHGRNVDGRARAVSKREWMRDGCAADGQHEKRELPKESLRGEKEKKSEQGGQRRQKRMRRVMQGER